jgi:hypothetical protein
MRSKIVQVKWITEHLKKINMRILIMLLLATQIQAQSPCDTGMSYTTGSLFQFEVAFSVGGNTPSSWAAPLYAVTYGNGTVIGEDSCFGQPCNHTVYNYNMLTGMPYDTVMTCVSYVVSDSLQNIDTLYCCFEQVWDPINQQWFKLMLITNIYEISELKSNDNKMYDLYGRPVLNPKGIYIQNRKIKYVR